MFEARLKKLEQSFIAFECHTYMIPIHADESEDEARIIYEKENDIKVDPRDLIFFITSYIPRRDRVK